MLNPLLRDETKTDRCPLRTVRVGQGYIDICEMWVGDMDTSHEQVKRTLHIGAGMTAAGLLAGVVFVPLLVFAAATFVATVVIAAVFSSRGSHRWAWTWMVGSASVVWVSSAVSAIDVWGQVFDFRDANQPVPLALGIALMVAFSLSVAGLIVVMLSAVMSLLRARRLDPRTRVQSSTPLAGA